MMWPVNWETDMWKIHGDVNQIKYVGDAQKYRKADFWTAIIDSGDCEDYAIAKLQRLLLRGWPVQALHLACCWTETKEYHAVLVVDTPQGAFILDNRLEIPVLVDKLNELGYKPHVIQAVGGQKQWKEWLP